MVNEKTSFIHFVSVVSLLDCLNQLKAENDSLEAKMVKLQTRRDHLRSVNSRLSALLVTMESTMKTPNNNNHTTTNGTSSSSSPSDSHLLGADQLLLPHNSVAGDHYSTVNTGTSKNSWVDGALEAAVLTCGGLTQTDQHLTCSSQESLAPSRSAYSHQG